MSDLEKTNRYIRQLDIDYAKRLADNTKKVAIFLYDGRTYNLDNLLNQYGNSFLVGETIAIIAVYYLVKTLILL